MKIEPRADMRVMAATMMQANQAFLDVGFNEEQAFRLVRDTLIASIQGVSDKGGDE